jgi:hypothetical protein
MQSDHLRSRLTELAGRSDPYDFLSIVGDYLAVVPDDDQLRATAVSTLVQKQLYGIAAELADGCPPTSPNYGKLKEFAAQFARRPVDRVDWSSTQARFDANLEALAGRGPEKKKLTDSIRRAWTDMPPQLTLHKSADGNLLVRAARSNGQRTWLPAAQDFLGKLEAAPSPDAYKGQFVSPFLLDGVGIGCLIPRLYETTRNTFLEYSPAIFIV